MRDAISGHQWSSVVIRDGRGSDREPHLMRDAISGHQWSSEDRSCEIHTCCHAPCAGSRSAIDRDCSRDCERARCSPAGREAVRSGLPRLASAPFWVAASNACAASSLMRGAIRGHPRSSEVIRSPQRSSEVLRGPQRSSEALRGPQRPSEALRGPQRPSECISPPIKHAAISGHPRSSAHQSSMWRVSFRSTVSFRVC